MEGARTLDDVVAVLEDLVAEVRRHWDEEDAKRLDRWARAGAQVTGPGSPDPERIAWMMQYHLQDGPYGIRGIEASDWKAWRAHEIMPVLRDMPVVGPRAEARRDAIRALLLAELAKCQPDAAPAAPAIPEVAGGAVP